jgi:lysophospholipase L1-like esterase
MDTTWFNHHKALTVCICLGLLLFLFMVGEILYIVWDGTPVPRPVISRDAQTVGSGPTLNYVIVGDSTAVAQGTDYDQGYSVASAKHLAKTHTVRWTNFAVSGSRAQDVLQKQLPKALLAKPDIVLVAVGANDVTHFTSPHIVVDTLRQCIQQLQSVNPNVAIILTGAPDMGSVPRFPQPIRWLAGVRTVQLNKAIAELTEDTHTTFAPVAKETGPIFRKHPEYFAADDFHPNAAGYNIWKPVINHSLDAALAAHR